MKETAWVTSYPPYKTTELFLPRMDLARPLAATKTKYSPNFFEPLAIHNKEVTTIAVKNHAQKTKS
jgi:hypothetical protein